MSKTTVKTEKVGGGFWTLPAHKLKHVVAELTLDNRALKDVLSKNW